MDTKQLTYIMSWYPKLTTPFLISMLGGFDDALFLNPIRVQDSKPPKIKLERV